MFVSKRLIVSYRVPREKHSIRKSLTDIGFLAYFFKITTLFFSVAGYELFLFESLNALLTNLVTGPKELSNKFTKPLAKMFSSAHSVL